MVLQIQGPEDALILRGGGKGLLAVGTGSGKILFIDPRTGGRIEHTVEAHVAGLQAMDVQSGLLTSCGYGHRAGKTVLETHVRVGPYVPC
jgi:hypothetical protein